MAASPSNNPMNIWGFSRKLTADLFIWNTLNILTGVWLARRGGIWRGIASQSIGWGLINLAIAMIGGQATEQRLQRIATPEALEIQQKESRNLRRILWINAGLDLLYMYGGWRFARSRRYDQAQGRGVGYGIVLQGLLLFIFDTTRAQQVPTAITASGEVAPKSRVSIPS